MTKKIADMTPEEREKRNAYQRERYKLRSEQDPEWVKTRREKMRVYHKERAATDPEWARKEYERKREYRKAALESEEQREKERVYQRERRANRTPEKHEECKAKARDYAKRRREAEYRPGTEFYERVRANQKRAVRFYKQSDCQVTNQGGEVETGYRRGGRGVPQAALVDTCHIKPRKHCSGGEAKDRDNVLRLDVRLHRLFDGLNVTVAPNGELMLRSTLPEAVAAEWRGKSVSGYTPANDRYMSFHRKLCYYHGFTEDHRRETAAN